jgi:hypothetical protein
MCGGVVRACVGVCVCVRVCLQIIRLTEDDTTSSSRIFIKYLFQVTGSKLVCDKAYGGGGAVGVWVAMLYTSKVYK